MKSFEIDFPLADIDETNTVVENECENELTCIINGGEGDPDSPGSTNLGSQALISQCDKTGLASDMSPTATSDDTKNLTELTDRHLCSVEIKQSP